MSSATLYRWSGGTLIAASLLILISSVLSNALYPGHNTTPQQDMSLPWLLVTLVTIIGSLLFVIGLPGMYLRQAGRAGVLGFVGFILVFFGFLLQGATFSTLQVTVLPWVAQVAPKLLEGNLPAGVFLLLIVSGLMYIIGAILLGIATMRARVFPRWAGVLLIIAGICLLLTLPPVPPILDAIIESVSFIAFSVASIWCGYLLMTREQESVEAVSLPAAGAGASQ